MFSQTDLEEEPPKAANNEFGLGEAELKARRSGKYEAVSKGQGKKIRRPICSERKLLSVQKGQMSTANKTQQEKTVP